MTSDLDIASPSATTPVPLLELGSPDPAVGLTSEQVRERREAGQVNVVTRAASRTGWSIIKANVFTRINAIVGVLFVVVVSFGPIQDGLFGLVIVANSAIGIIQEFRAKRKLDALALLERSPVQVRRDGVPVEIPPTEVVRDDVIVISAGDKIPVDGRVAVSVGLELDESLLTGEADPVAKRVGDEVLSGSFVVAGSGAFVAEKVGDDAYANQLVAQVKRFELAHSELMAGINKILRVITWIIVPLGIAVAITQLLSDQTFPEAMVSMVAGIVPMVPEGLVLMTSIAFAVGVIRLAQRRCLVQELPAIEMLARVDTLCLDKTGTLTEPGMALENIEMAAGASDEDRAEARGALAALARMEARPNPTMRAIADAVEEVNWSPQASIPFSSARKYSAAAFKGRGAWCIGAPEVILAPDDALRNRAQSLSATGLRVLALGRLPESAFSIEALTDNSLVIDPLTVEPLVADSAFADSALANSASANSASANSASANSASANSASANSDQPAPLAAPEALPGPVTAVALVVLRQRLRSDAAKTLKFLKEEGVNLKIFSGDNAASVAAVAAAAGVPGASSPIDARELPENPDELAAVLNRHSVFGRVMPEQKRAFVSLLRDRGHTVGMTGDGVNDALALKGSDLGIAMGSGSPATRGVAKVVLLDNSFATMPRVLAEGRRVLGNIERVASLFLVKTMYSLVLALMVSVAGVPWPLLPRHVTLVGSLTIGIPAFFLALAPNLQRWSPGFVTRVLRKAMPAGLVCGTAAFVAYGLARVNAASGQVADRTTAALTLFLCAVWTLALVARPYTWWRAGLVAAMVAGFALVAAVPFGREFFALDFTNPRNNLIAAATGAAGMLAILLLFRFRKAGTPS